MGEKRYVEVVKTLGVEENRKNISTRNVVEENKTNPACVLIAERGWGLSPNLYPKQRYL